MYLRANLARHSFEENRWGPSDRLQALIRPHIYHKAGVSLPAIWLVLIPPRDTAGPLLEMRKRMNGSHYSPWVMNSVLTWQVTVMYRPSPRMWHIEMIGVTAGTDGFCSAAAACVQSLNWRVGIHLKVGLKVKLKGCGAWLFQGYAHINSFPKVLFLSRVKWHHLQRQNYRAE